jgi:hypothetical protein
MFSSGVLSVEKTAPTLDTLSGSLGPALGVAERNSQHKPDLDVQDERRFIRLLIVLG